MLVNAKSVFLRIVACFAVLFVLLASASAQEPPLKIHYHLTMSRPSTHLFEVGVEVEIPEETKIDSLGFQMPKWSPGRYAVFDFAKNVQETSAVDGFCLLNSRCGDVAMRPVTRIDDQTWRVTLFDSRRLTLRYKVFANDLSGTFSQLDSRHANFNGGCIFMYVVNHKQDPVTLVIDPPKDWRIVNGHTEGADQREWRFPNWDIMIDTPTEIGRDWTQDDFKLDGKSYHVVVHSMGNEGGKRAALVRDIERIAKTETTMWGPPEFDSYTFLIHFANDGRSSDGMEHLNSTQVIMPGALSNSGMLEATIDGIAHEFFHVWNVKRLRPIELGPWDFARPANTRSLWIAEGITNYYGHLMQRRAGLWDDAKLLSTLAGQITEVENSPGSRLMSAEESSLLAPFIDDAVHAQHTNLENTSISYYSKGEVLGMVLDLLIRGKTKGKASLDDVMRRMYDEFYLQSPNATYYLRGRGYKSEDFERVTSEVAGTDMNDFFKRYVRGVELPPYNEAFAQVGLRLASEPRTPATVGMSADESDQANFKIGNVRSNSPAAEAGLEVGDIVTSFGGTRLTPANFIKTLARYKPGDRVALTIQRAGKMISISITMGRPQVFNYRIEEIMDASTEAKALRAAWLNGK